MAWPPILVRYGEIGIKSRQVRTQFERRLKDRIEEALIRRGVEAEVQREEGRFLVRASDTELALDALKHTFGIVSASPATECDPTPDGVAAVAFDLARASLPQGGSFAMRCRRVGQHPFTSLDVAKRVAARILDEMPERKPRVDLDAPDLELFSEVRNDMAFVYTRTERCPGGLPLGSQGKVVVLVDGPRAAHAAWLAGKRGSSLVFACPDVDAAARWLAPLHAWIGEPRLHPCETSPEALRELAAKHHCHAIVRSEDADGAIALFEQDRELGYPVFRPLVGYAGERFRAFAKQAELPEV